MRRILMIILGFVLAIACFVAFVYLYQPRGAFICDFSGDDATKHYTNDSVFNIFQDVPIEDAKVYIAMAPDDRDNLPFCKATLMLYIHHAQMSWQNLPNRWYLKRPLATW